MDIPRFPGVSALRRKPPLLGAVQAGDLDACELLLSAGADPKVIDDQVRPLMYNNVLYNPW